MQQFKAPARKQQSRRSMVQTVEMSTTNSGAKAAYDVMRGWFGGCTDARVQLISTYDVDRVGDDATLLVLRSWKKPETTMVAGVARTGRATTVTFTRAQDTDRPDLAGEAGLLADAVNGLCALPGDRAVRREARDRRQPRPSRPATSPRCSARWTCRRSRASNGPGSGPRPASPSPTWPPAGATPPGSTPRACGAT